MKEITLACEAFQKLLEEQLERIRNMNGEKTDFSTKKQVTIGVIDGDGIGPVITAQATRVLEKLLAEEIAAGSIVIRQIEGLTIENRMACGKAIPDDVLAEIKTCDVLLKGPTTTPMGGKMESANVAMRRELDLYANCRPVCIPEKNIDWMFFRENTEGEYVLGSRGVELPGMAVDFKVTTDPGTRRIARAAFDYARRNGKTRVAVVTKANIMKKTDGKFTAICHEAAADYPGITVDDYYIDIMTANLLKEPLREQFQVVLLPNLYGDIITDGGGVPGRRRHGGLCQYRQKIRHVRGDPRLRPPDDRAGHGGLCQPGQHHQGHCHAAPPHLPRRCCRASGKGHGGVQS